MPPETAKYFFSLLIIVFLINAVLLVRLWVIISEYQKIENLIKNIRNIKNFFLTSRLNELSQAAKQNPKYKLIFHYFHKKYLLLLDDGVLVTLDKLNKANEIVHNNQKKERKDPKLHILELKMIYLRIENLNKQIHYVFAWENFCYEKINSFSLIVEKLYEEIEKTKLTVDFNFQYPKDQINFFQVAIKDIESKVNDSNYNKVFLLMKKTLENVKKFNEELTTWLKLLFFFRKMLPTKIEKFTFFIANNVHKVTDTWMKTKNIEIKTKMLNFHNKLNRFADPINLELKIIEMYKDLESIQEQIENQTKERNFFILLVSHAEKLFNLIKNEFSSLDKLIDSFGREIFFFQYKKIEHRELRKRFIDTQSAINDFLIEKHNVEKTMFFRSFFAEIHSVFEQIQEMNNDIKKMNEFLAFQRSDNENFYLLIINLMSLLQKKENIYLYEIFWEDFKKIMTEFVNLKKKIIKNDVDKVYLEKFNNLMLKFKSLKLSITNKIMLRSIAEGLLISANKFRAQNIFIANKVLNSEISFAHKNYKTTIENMIDLLENEIQ